MPMFFWREYQNEVSLVPVPTIETNMCKLLSIVLICHSAKLSAFLSNLSPTYPVHSYVNGSDSIDDLKLNALVRVNAVKLAARWLVIQAGE